MKWFYFSFNEPEICFHDFCLVSDAKSYACYNKNNGYYRKMQDGRGFGRIWQWMTGINQNSTPFRSGRVYFQNGNEEFIALFLSGSSFFNLEPDKTGLIKNHLQIGDFEGDRTSYWSNLNISRKWDYNCSKIKGNSKTILFPSFEEKLKAGQKIKYRYLKTRPDMRWLRGEIWWN